MLTTDSALAAEGTQFHPPPTFSAASLAAVFQLNCCGAESTSAFNRAEEYGCSSGLHQGLEGSQVSPQSDSRRKGLHVV